MITIGELYIAMGIVIAFVAIIFLTIVAQEKKTAYRMGQIDAMNNKFKIKLVEFPNGVRAYLDEKELKDFTDYIIIK